MWYYSNSIQLMPFYKKIIIFTGLVFLVIQLIPTTRNQDEAITTADFMEYYEVPSVIQTKLKQSCYDCHSNNTQYPWYQKIQPISLFLEKHIKEGKEELNFNEFGTLSKRQQKSKLKSIINQINDGEMPLLSYTLIHRDAVFTEKEKEQITLWLNTIRDSL